MHDESSFKAVLVTVGEVVADLLVDGRVVGRYGLKQDGRLSAPLPSRKFEELFLFQAVAWRGALEG